MGRRSWIHLIYSKHDYERLYEGIKNNEFIFEVGAAILDGTIHCRHQERIFGEKGKKSLVVLTQSDGAMVIDELEEKGAIIDRFTVFHLDDVDPSLLEHTKRGVKIKNATYIPTFEEFEKILEVFEQDVMFNNAAYQSHLMKKADALLYMCYFCRIVVGIFSFCQEKGKDKNLELLFEDAQGIVDDLGYWYHLDHFPPSFIIEDVKIFLKRVNTINQLDFNHIKEYLEDLGNNLIAFLSTITQEENYLPSESKEMNPEIRLLMWQLGELKVRIIDRSQREDKPIPYQPFVALKDLFTQVTSWIYEEGNETTIVMVAKRVNEEIEQFNFIHFKEEFNRVLETSEHIVNFFAEESQD